MSRRCLIGGLGPDEVRIAVKAAGLNFWDVFRSLAFIQEGNLGREVCGDVLEIGSEVTTVSVGDHVVGLGFGAFAAEMVTHGELVARAPEGFSVSEMATVPSALFQLRCPMNSRVWKLVIGCLFMPERVAWVWLPFSWLRS